MKIFIVIALITAVIACNNAQDQLTTATVEWTGEYAADGCGFFVTVDGKEYKPVNESFIDEQFKVPEKTEVLIEYKDLNEKKAISCGMLPNNLERETMELISIKRK